MPSGVGECQFTILAEGIHRPLSTIHSRVHIPGLKPFCVFVFLHLPFLCYVECFIIISNRVYMKNKLIVLYSEQGFFPIFFILINKKIKGKGMFVYSAVSSPLDFSKRFNLFLPWQTCSFRHKLGFSWKHSSHAAIAQ